MVQPDIPTIARLGLARETLAGQVAVVTGAGQGIGQEAARALAWLGAQVVVAELGERGGHTESLVAQAGGVALWVPVDVADEASVAHLVQRARESFGPASILVNNAIISPVIPVLEMEAVLWDQVIAVNLRGPFLTCRAFVPGMVARGQGTVVNLVSGEAMPGLAPYVASQQGIAGFSQSLALEVGSQGVRVVALAPGLVDTAGLQAAAAGLAPRLGMDRQQFLALSLHPAHPGPMPAEHAGAAVAYLVAALADQYHGGVVTGYEILERAGFLRPSVLPAGEVLPPEAPAAGDAAADGAPTAAWGQAAALAGRLREALDETAAEFDRLPALTRPLARRGFKTRAGQSLPAWQQAAAALAVQAGQAQAGDPQARAELRAELRPLEARLEALKGYYLEAPVGAARFSRNAAFLAQVAEVSTRRAAVVDALRAAVQRAVGK